MKKLQLIGLVIVGLLTGCVTSPTQNANLLAGKRVLILGDSITQKGTYVSFVEYYLNKLYPTEKFDIISVGLSSETASGLSEEDHPFPRPWIHNRLQNALKEVKPDLVIACYGMNDGLYYPVNDERMSAYQKGVNRLASESKAAGAKVILMTPPPFDPLPISNRVVADADTYSYRKPYTHYNETLQTFGAWLMNDVEGVEAVIDLNGVMSEYIDKRRKSDLQFTFSKDGIHPADLGHLLMAQTLLRGMGISVGADDLVQDLKELEADQMFPLVKKKREMRSDAWLKFIGYTRGNTVKENSLGNVEKQVIGLQEQIDAFKPSVGKVYGEFEEGSVVVAGLRRIFEFDHTGKNIWSIKAGNCHDVWKLDNGNVLYADGEIKEVNPINDELVFSYTSKVTKGGGAYSCQRLVNGNTVIGENSTGKILEVDKAGEAVFELQTSPYKPGDHHNLRMVRKLENGNYLVCHSGQKLVKEYAPDGTVVFEVKAKNLAFSAVRLPNGNTLVGDIKTATEFDPSGKIVWELNAAEDLKEYEIGMITGLNVLPNGNMVIGIYDAKHNEKGAGVFEVTREKKIIWRYVRLPKGDRSLMSAQKLDASGKAISKLR